MADHHFTDTNFQSDVIASSMPVVVDFWAEWCPPCKLIGPIIDELAKKYEGKVVIGKMDTDANTQIPANYNIMSIPTVMIFKNGQPIQSLIGAQSKQTYESAIEKALTA